MTIAAQDLAQDRIAEFAGRVQAIREQLHQVVVGQDATIDLLLTCALTGSHALLVGVPGLAKTLMVKALAATFDWKFSRIQFTPDLMPSDITGYELLGRSERRRQRDDLSPRAGLRQPGAGRRDQPRRPQNPVGPAGGDGRAARHRRRPDLSAGRAVLGRGHAKPDRAGRNLSAARGPAGPLHDGNPPRLSQPAAGRRDRLRDDRRRSADAAGGLAARRVLAASRPGAGGAGAEERGRPRRASVPVQPARRSAVPANSSRTTWPGAPARAARKTWCWPPRPGRCCSAGRLPRSKTSRPLSLPILRHRVIVNHRAVGDGVSTEAVVARLVAEGGE